MRRKVNFVEDLDGNKIVVIHDIRFKGRQAIEWKDVERYLKQYVGEAHIIESTKDMVFICNKICFAGVWRECRY